MILQIDVRRCSTGLCVICFIHHVLINTVQCKESHFILPALPDTPYTLDDVIILPENKDYVETTILTTEAALILATINVTLETGFRLCNVCEIQNATIESGLQIITSSKVDVILQLPTGILHLPPTTDSGDKYFLLKGSVEDNSERILFIQSKYPDTTVNLCLLSYKADEIIDKSIPNSHEFSSTHKCRSKNITAFEKLLLNNTSMLHGTGIEITSDNPVSVLEGHRTHLSSLVRNERDFNTSKSPVAQITWYIIPPYRDLSNQFVLIPCQDRREVKLWIMSPEKTSVDIVTNGDTIPLSLTANKLGNISLSVEQGNTVSLVGKKRFSFICEESNAINCNKDIFPVNVLGTNDTSIYSVLNESMEYQWIYISNKTDVKVICPTFVKIGLYSLNGSKEYSTEINFDIGNQMFIIKHFDIVADGLYRLLYNPPLHLCSVFHSKREISFSNNNLQEEENYLSDSSSLLLKSLKMSDNESIVSTTISVELQNISASSPSLDFLTTNNETVTLETENSTLSYKLKLQNTAFTTRGSRKKPEMESKTINEHAFNRDPNERFRAVVDILHTSNGTVNTLMIEEKQSSNRENPTYIYRLDINDRYDQEGDGKSPLAVIVSLVSALLAVGAIILIFLLKEFFSRRKQIRNTRIRPFISYY